jgi:serine phosphatase RsbU (regulator of sigma subunit)
MVVADCTGHGVPGAFLSLVGHATLVRALSKTPELDPAQILTFIDAEISRILGKQPGLDLKEGIEMSVCVINRMTHALRFAGARCDILIVCDEKVETAHGSRRSVGGVYARQAPESWQFETQYFNLPKTCSLYQLSDGFTDQHGADGIAKFGQPRLRKLLKEISQLSACDQVKRLDEALETWRKTTEQTDDILLVGLRMG